jgi:hypothetical protein
VIYGMGEAHRRAVSRLKAKFWRDVLHHPAKIAFCETIRGAPRATAAT